MSQPPERAAAVRTARKMSRISMISNTRPRAATPQINSTAKVKDSDMAGSLVSCARNLVRRRLLALDLDQPAFHDRACRHVRFAPCHRPAIERRSRFGIAQTLIERPSSGVVVLNQHPGQRPTMINDLVLQGADQLCSDSQGLEAFVDRKHPDIARILRCAEVHTTHGDQPVVRQATHQQRNLFSVGGFECHSHGAQMLRPA
jgi:hypothetical protein